MEVLINTERLLIRNFKEDDWLNLYAYTSNPNVMEYMPSGVLNEDEAKQLVNNNLHDKAEKFAIILKEENLLIGHIEFLNTLVNILMK